MPFGAIPEAFRHLTGKEIRPGRGWPPLASWYHRKERWTVLVGREAPAMGRAGVDHGVRRRPSRRSRRRGNERTGRHSANLSVGGEGRWSAAARGALVQRVASFDIDKCTLLVGVRRWR
jgi:hypothetical protein